MSTSQRWGWTAVTLMILAVITFCVAWSTHQWNGLMLLATVFALGGMFASFGADD